jgi:hypothetical protein
MEEYYFMIAIGLYIPARLLITTNMRSYAIC